MNLRSSARQKQLTAATLSPGGLEIDSERLTIVIPTIQGRDGGPSLMAFHFDETKSSALSREDVDNHIYRMHFPERGEQLSETFFRGRGRQIADEQFLQ